MRPYTPLMIALPLLLSACPAVDNTLDETTSPNTAVPDNAILVNDVRVIDGDTVEVLIAGKESERVRLQGIDAPEKKQAFGSKSIQTLTNCLSQTPIHLVAGKTDHYGRVVGIVYGGGVDCNLNQIKKGAAWHYAAYKKEQSAENQALYAKAEQQARKKKVGLWRDGCPIAPWDYRKKLETCTLP